MLRGINQDGLGGPTPAPPDDGFDDVAPGQIDLEKLEYVFWPLLVLTFGLIKMAVVLFYRSVFVVNANVFNIVTWAAIAISGAWTVAFICLMALLCGSHPASFWGSFEDLTSYCLDGNTVLLCLASTDLATDLLVFLLPFPVIWRLHMRRDQKVKLTALLVVAAVSLIASAFRLAIHVQQLQLGYEAVVDIFLTFSLIYYWSILEAGIALVALNLPTTWHLFSGYSIQSEIGSVRSTLSLDSIRPNTDKSDGNNTS